LAQNHKFILRFITSLSLLAALSLLLLGQDRTKVITVSRVEKPPEIDGLIEDKYRRGRESGYSVTLKVSFLLRI
jgi:hypothetical protein